jgi:ABC-type oligopeptide transport system substrate-binding subunit
MACRRSGERAPWAVAIGVLAAFLAAGCGGGGGDEGADERSSAAASTRPQELRVGSAIDPPATLDPGHSQRAEDRPYLDMLYAGLLRERADGSTEGDVAERVEQSEDGLVYTFHLRQGATWSDGKPLTAHDFVYAWRRQLDSAAKGVNPDSEFLFGIANAAEYQEGKVAAEKLGARAVDDTTLEVRLAEASPDFEKIVATPVFSAVPRHVAEQAKGDWTAGTEFVVSGPFELSSREPRRLVFTQNDEYWNADEVELKEVEARFSQTFDGAFSLYEGDEVDVLLSSITAETAHRARSEEGFETVSLVGTEWLTMNPDSEQMKNRELRAAVSMALDRSALVEEGFLFGTPVSTVVPPSVPGFETIVEEAQPLVEEPEGEVDAGAVKAQLAKAGWKSGDSLLLMGLEDSPRSLAVQRVLTRAGIKVQLRSIEEERWEELLAPPFDPEMDLVVGSWQAYYNDARDMYTALVCSDFSRTGYCNPKFDEAVYAMDQESDPEERARLAAKAEAIITGPDGDHPIAPIASTANANLVRPYVRGLEVFPTNRVYFDRVSIS